MLWFPELEKIFKKDVDIKTTSIDNRLIYTNIDDVDVVSKSSDALDNSVNLLKQKIYNRKI